MGTVNAADYQLVPLTKLLVNGLGGVLVCDGVGVGKTISAGHALIYLTSHCASSGAVVCPTSLLDKWRFELRDKFGFQALVLDTREAFELASDSWSYGGSNPNRIYVIPFSLLSRNKIIRPFRGPIVIDEIHNLRNHETALFSAVQMLTSLSPFRIGLTATPVNNSLDDLASELAVIFKVEFHIAEVLVQDLWREEKRHLLYPAMTRFSKEKLGIHFVRRDIHSKWISLSREYWEEVSSIVKSLRGRGLTKTVYRDEITWLRLATSSPRAFLKSTGLLSVTDNSKIEAALKILSDHGMELVLVFCDFEETAWELAESIDGLPVFTITGTTPIADRTGLIEQFRKSDAGCLIMTSVGSEGLDVQFCSVLINYDLSWNPMVLEQRIGRIDRLGQLKGSVKVFNLIVEDSIDARIIRVLGEKLGLTEGSPLESRGLLGNHGKAAADAAFREVISDESHKAALLTRSLEVSANIIPNDYGVIGSIDTSFCRPEVLSGVISGGSLPAWLRDTEQGKEWLAQLLADSKELRATLERYT